jgi:hypothetical protein
MEPPKPRVAELLTAHILRPRRSRQDVGTAGGGRVNVAAVLDPRPGGAAAEKSAAAAKGASNIVGKTPVTSTNATTATPATATKDSAPASEAPVKNYIAKVGTS